MQKLRIALIEPFYTGSHKKWAEDYKLHSSHDIKIFNLPGRFWKWRMHGGAISLAKKVLESKKRVDIFIVSDFLDLPLFKSLVIKEYHNAKFIVYFHENQLTYPWSPTDNDILLKRDVHYSFINYSSALVADKVFFNSLYHRNSFLGELPKFLKKFPDENNLHTIDIIKQKSKVLYLALTLPQSERNIRKVKNLILWNHRWEYDKNPNLFFEVLKGIKSKGLSFKLVILGENTKQYPEIFDWAKDYFKNEIVHIGYLSSNAKYWEWLQMASILPVTSNQDFFGISIVEAMHAGVYPLLPNRLSYPEHIPLEFQYLHLYDSKMELENEIIKLLSGDFRKNDFSKWVNKYSWKNSIEKYDAAMSSI